MRNVVLVFLLLNFGCVNSPTEELLVGTWKYNMDATLEEMQGRGAAETEINYMKSILIGLKEASISFQDNGEVLFSMPEIEENGSWKILKRNNELILDLNGNEQRSIIDHIVSDTLILTPPEGEDGLLRVLTNS